MGGHQKCFVPCPARSVGNHWLGSFSQAGHLLLIPWAVIKLVLDLAGYTYGPLLGLFTLGLFTKVRAGGPLLPLVCVASPALCWVLSQNSATWFGGYRFGFELLLLNGLFTAVGVATVARQPATQATP